MHCPQCGGVIGSDEISYCTKCGQRLERIRAAMNDEAMITRGSQVSRAGVNIGVALMYIGLWPALAAVLLSSNAIPLAFLMVSVALVAIVVGSGPLLRLFQTDEVHPEVERARRKEIAFGSTLMYLGTILATLIVAVVTPDAWVRMALIGSITGMFGVLLASSKFLYTTYRELVSNEPTGLGNAKTAGELTTGSLDQDVVELRMAAGNAGSYTNALEPRSVTEGTTCSLDLKLDKAE